jgi:hypothetical protein
MHRAAALLESAEQRLRQSHPDLKRLTPGGRIPARLWRRMKSRPHGAHAFYSHNKAGYDDQ